MSQHQHGVGRVDRMKEDPLWKMTAYRLAVYAAEAGWEDTRSVQRQRMTEPLASQLYRALGSIGANLAEGYSRSSGRDRVRFFGYALGSAREGRHWYRALSGVLGHETVEERCDTLNQISHLLLAVIPAERRRTIGRRG